MEFNNVNGRYSLSLFRMFIDTNANFDTLAKVPTQHLATYFHEYFHFLQDITTSFGHNIMWHEYERTGLLIYHVQQAKKDIQLPLKNLPELHELDIEGEFMKAVFMDQFCLIDGKPFMGSLSVNAVALRIRKEYFLIEGSELIRFVQLAVDDGKGNVGEYWFGAIAVIETMTYLIQKKFFGKAGAADLPYMAGVRLAEHVYSVIGTNEEFVFAVCELALTTQYPGWTFYDLLVQMRDAHYVPTKAEDIYDFCIPYLEKKWHITERFDYYRDRIEFHLKQLYGHAAYKENLEWHLTIVKNGYELRTKDPILLLKLYQQQRPFDPYTFTFLDALGAPELMNNERKRWFSTPHSIKHLEGTVHTLFLSAFGQIQDTLMNGSTRCSLYEHCKGSEQKMPLNHHCFESPWEKAKQDPLCPFAATWKVFGLDAYPTKAVQLDIEDVDIEISEATFNELGFAKFRTGQWVASGVGDYMVRVDPPHIPGGQRHIHIAHAKNKSAKGEQVSWNVDGTRHDKKSFKENFVGLEQAKHIARTVLGIKDDVTLHFFVGNQSIEDVVAEKSFPINIVDLSFSQADKRED